MQISCDQGRGGEEAWKILHSSPALQDQLEATPRLLDEDPSPGVEDTIWACRGCCGAKVAKGRLTAGPHQARAHVTAT